MFFCLVKSSSKVANKSAATSTGASSIKKAQSAKKAATKGQFTTIKKKIVTSATFRRPKTLELPRNPKYVRKSIHKVNKLDQYSILRNPLTTESAMKNIESHNTLVFICDVRANKHQIKSAMKKMYDVKVERINTLIRPDGKKKAFIKLSPDTDALDIANKIGFI